MSDYDAAPRRYGTGVDMINELVSETIHEIETESDGILRLNRIHDPVDPWEAFELWIVDSAVGDPGGGMILDRDQWQTLRNWCDYVISQTAD